MTWPVESTLPVEASVYACWYTGHIGYRRVSKTNLRFRRAPKSGNARISTGIGSWVSIVEGRASFRGITARSWKMWRGDWWEEHAFCYDRNHEGWLYGDSGLKWHKKWFGKKDVWAVPKGSSSARRRGYNTTSGLETHTDTIQPSFFSPDGLWEGHVFGLRD